MKTSALYYRFLTVGLLGTSLLSCNTKHRIWVGDRGDQKIFNLKYGGHKNQVMDIFLPANYAADTPVTMIIHGGAWKYGRKEHMIMIQKFLHQNNIPTVSIDYRHASKRKKITYKEQLQDIALASAKFNTLTAKAKLQPDHFVLLGESAGAHLALLYGYHNPGPVKKIISLSGPTDFYSNTYLRSAHSWYSTPTVQTMVGEKYIRTSVSEKFKEASPITNVSNVPTLLFQGDSDYLVHRKQALALDSVLTAKQIPHRLIFMKDTGHTPRFFNKYKRDSIILPAILDWIKK